MAGTCAPASVVGAVAKKSTAREISRSISKFSAELEVFCADVFAIAMSSIPAKRWALARKHSRSKRFTRLRSCARWICLFARAKPSRGRNEGFAWQSCSRTSNRAATSVTQAPEKRLPAANIRLYSAGKRSRAWRGKSMHDLLVGTTIHNERTN